MFDMFDRVGSNVHFYAARAAMLITMQFSLSIFVVARCIFLPTIDLKLLLMIVDIVAPAASAAPTKVNSKWLCRGRHPFFPQASDPNRELVSDLPMKKNHGWIRAFRVGKKDVFRDRAILSPL